MFLCNNGVPMGFQCNSNVPMRRKCSNVVMVSKGNSGNPVWWQHSGVLINKHLMQSGRHVDQQTPCRDQPMGREKEQYQQQRTGQTVQFDQGKQHVSSSGLICLHISISLSWWVDNARLGWQFRPLCNHTCTANRHWSNQGDLKARQWIWTKGSNARSLRERLKHF